MSDSVNIQELWNEHRDEFIKIYSRETVKPLTHSQLVKAFVDINGKQVYRFGREVALPIERFGKMKEYLVFMSKGLTDEEDQKFDQAIEDLLEQGLKDNRHNVAAIGAIMQEKKRRRKFPMHYELLYNFLAVQLVREDEHPEYFDADIHMDKIRTFKEMTRGEGSYFFFQKEELKRLSHLYSLSQDEWETLWAESIVMKESIDPILNLFTNRTTSTKPEKTSVSSF